MFSCAQSFRSVLSDTLRCRCCVGIVGPRECCKLLHGRKSLRVRGQSPGMHWLWVSSPGGAQNHLGAVGSVCWGRAAAPTCPALLGHQSWAAQHCSSVGQSALTTQLESLGITSVFQGLLTSIFQN